MMPAHASPMTDFPHEELASPASVDMSARAVEKLRARFRDQQAAGLFPGGQLVVRRRGRLVVDDAVGVARGWRNEDEDGPSPATTRTRFAVFSACKPLVAISIALLEERGQLDIDAPIARVFPDFAAYGKEEITTRDVLTHRAGIFMPDLIQRPEHWGDWTEVVRAMVTARPTSRRGVLAYHPFEFGWVLAEIVRRVSGRSLPQFVTDEIAGPAELPGLVFGAQAAELPSLARAYWLGEKPVMVAGMDIGVRFEEIANTPGVMTSFVPGAGLVTDGATLAAFYELLVAGGVTRSGRRVLAASTVHRYTRRHLFAWDHSNAAPQAVGLGFLLGTMVPSIYGYYGSDRCFGHVGAVSTMGFGDHATGVAAAIVTNGNRGKGDLVRRFLPLAHAIRAACR
jgi:CubicO group peptidase (beta-lactamase class C family)